MKILFFNILFFCCLFSYAQTSNIVVNSKSNTPISYVNIWVEGENIGTTTKKYGYFNLDKTSNNLVLYAVGYKTKKINVLNIKHTISLDPEVINLEKKDTKKRNKKLVEVDFIFSKINFFYGSGETPWMRGKYFRYFKKYKNTPFIKSFKIYTRSNLDSAKFNIRIYKKTNNFELQVLLYNKNIIGIAKKGNRLTEVDL
ncbi:MAG: carboxypeptidase-like regulatory domain-containing protein [Lacinutrix sp.]|uniref:carboxypeptidase-like regulatory domain-containing protein n=1 Tax=Lacinutrix sp. TaxID=1937692 RepID=UPI0030A79D78